MTHSFKPMLAKDCGNPSDLSYPQIAQPKLDGIRASVVNGQLLTRTLKKVPNLEIFTALSVPELEGFDGELLVGNPAAEDAYRRTTSFVMAQSKTDAPWTFHVFDRWTNPDDPFRKRYADLEDALSWGFPSHLRDFVSLVPSIGIPDADALIQRESEYIAMGYEGLILRDPHAAYKFGRSGKKGPLLKVKRFIDFEAEVIGVYEEMHNANEAKTNALGRTERSSHQAGKVGKGTLGGLILRAVNGPAEGMEFRCGTGFDSTMRAGLWNQWHNPNDAPGAAFGGAIVKVKSFPIGVKDKPRHPVFLGFRDLEIDG